MSWIGDEIGHKVKVEGEFREEANVWKPFSHDLSHLGVGDICQQFETYSTNMSHYRGVSLYVSTIIQLPWEKLSPHELESQLALLLDK